MSPLPVTAVSQIMPKVDASATVGQGNSISSDATVDSGGLSAPNSTSTPALTLNVIFLFLMSSSHETILIFFFYLKKKKSTDEVERLELTVHRLYEG